MYSQPSTVTIFILMSMSTPLFNYIRRTPAVRNEEGNSQLRFAGVAGFEPATS